MKLITSEEIFEIRRSLSNRKDIELGNFESHKYKEWISLDDLKKHFKGANPGWEAEVLEKEVHKYNDACNNICNIASDLRFKLNMIDDLMYGDKQTPVIKRNGLIYINPKSRTKKSPVNNH